jgi:hypothetical protein
MPGARDAGLTPFNETCREQAHIVLPPFGVVSNYTAEDIEKIHRVEQNETEGATLFTEVVIPSETWFGIWWDTLVSESQLWILDTIIILIMSLGLGRIYI